MLRRLWFLVTLVALAVSILFSSGVTRSYGNTVSFHERVLLIRQFLKEDSLDLRTTPRIRLERLLKSFTEFAELFSASQHAPYDLEELVFHFINVGQGDAILIQMPCDAFILVDGGPRSAADKLLDYLYSQEIEEIDIMVATHAHEDHIGGLVAVFESDIGVLVTYDSGYVHDSILYRDFISLAEEHSEVRKAERDQEISLCTSAVIIEILHPPGAMRDANNSSIVLRVAFEEIAVLLTGDAETQAEQLILEHFDPSSLRSNILKVAHHGSRTSTTAAFLHAVDPEVAIIMVGDDNSFGHPHEEVIIRLQSREIDIYRTDIHGTIIVTVDFTGFTIDAVPWADIEIRCVDINSASVEELQRIVHIGPGRAEEVVALRPFSSLEELQKVSGIGPARLGDIIEQGLVCVILIPSASGGSDISIIRHDCLILH